MKFGFCIVVYRVPGRENLVLHKMSFKMSQNAIKKPLQVQKPVAYQVYLVGTACAQ